MPYRKSKTPKPSEQLADLISGKVAPKDAPAPILSWARLSFYMLARDVVSVDDEFDRIALIAKIPKANRPYVQAEVARIEKIGDSNA